MSVNRVILIGHIGQELELKYTISGQAVCNMRLATSEKYTDKQGNKQDKTEWHNVVLFGTTAENASKYLNKGSQVYIDGKIQTRKWQSKDGSDHYTTEIIANEMRFLDSKSENKTASVADSYQSKLDFIAAEKAKMAQQKAPVNVGAMMKDAGLMEEQDLPF